MYWAQIRGKLIKRVEEVTGKRDDGAVSNLPQFPESNDPGQLAGGRCYYITREQPTRRVRVWNVFFFRNYLRRKFIAARRLHRAVLREQHGSFLYWILWTAFSALKSAKLHDSKSVLFLPQIHPLEIVLLCESDYHGWRWGKEREYPGPYVFKRFVTESQINVKHFYWWQTNNINDT